MDTIDALTLLDEREFCSCGNLMKCETKFEHRIVDENSLDYIIEIFKIFTCPACDEVTLIYYSSSGNSDEEEYSEISRDELELDRSYRRRVLYAPRKRTHFAIPSSIAEVTNQAQSVLYHSPRASFILCRAVLEEICNDFKIPTEEVNSKSKSYFISLKERLTRLFEQEKMSEDLIAIIQGIRELGNEGAHSDHLTFTQQVKAEDAENLLTLVNYVIERLYVEKYRQQEAEEVLSKLTNKILPSES